MNCQEVMELMQRDLDRDLNDSEHEAMTAHLQQCPDCAEMYSRLRQLSQELASLPKVAPPFSLVDSILPQLAEIDRQGDGLAATATATAGAASVSVPAPVTAIPAPIERPRRTRGIWSIAATGGIVAAGLLMALFINDMDGTNKVADDRGLLYSSAESTAAPQSASQQNRASGGAPAMDAKSDTSDADGSAGNMEKKLPLGTAITNQSGGSEAPSPDKETAERADPAVQPRFQPAKPSEQANAGQEAGAQEIGERSGINTYTAPDDVKKPETNAEAGSGSPGADIAPPRMEITAPALGDSTGDQGTDPAITEKNTITADKGREEQPESISSDSAKSGRPDAMGLMANPNPELLSEDGVLIAVADQARRSIVIRTTDGKETHMYTSPQWSENEQVRLLKWSGSSKLTYSLTTESGVTKRIEIDVAQRKETNIQQP